MIEIDNHELDVNYNVNGVHLEKALYEPEARPEIEIVDVFICRKDKRRKIKNPSEKLRDLILLRLEGLYYGK